MFSLQFVNGRFSPRASARALSSAAGRCEAPPSAFGVGQQRSAAAAASSESLSSAASSETPKRSIGLFATSSQGSSSSSWSKRESRYVATSRTRQLSWAARASAAERTRFSGEPPWAASLCRMSAAAQRVSADGCSRPASTSRVAERSALASRFGAMQAMALSAEQRTSARASERQAPIPDRSRSPQPSASTASSSAAAERTASSGSRRQAATSAKEA
mmetsp:Transcript_50210/g.129447  ORF Transcript_50210/g.129447 Transcript_50210/m.129447 type:complete len:218 (-) Transcript_50210:7-660(-)